MRDFICLSLTPIGLAHTGLAVATARAGGVAVLDREFCKAADLPRADSNLKRLLELVGDDSEIGLRLRCDQVDESRGLLDQLCRRSHWLILCGWDISVLSKLQSSLPPALLSRRLLLEITNVNQLSALTDDVSVQGLVARGHESGGWVGDDSAFILSQKLLAAQSRPVYVQGGVGIHNAAACRGVGAAGVVLDDQLWLMPESPLPSNWQSFFGRLSGQETILAGERLGAGCRILSRPGLHAAISLQKYAEQLEIEQNEPDAPEIIERWQEKAQSTLGWGAPELNAWPLGQSVGLAARLCDQYKTTGRLIQALLAASRQHIELARSLRPLAPEGPMAASHGTRYPVVQGPMTRVSDTANFAAAVAHAGGLPLLALALMKRAAVKSLLEKTSELLKERPWGIGILGFVPQELREEQIQAVQEIRPPFALIAGGRPDQAAQLEELGIATYIHVPTPGLLKTFLAKGARRFVFEGRECGGHVGPLTSFMLWESMIETLLEEVTPGMAAEVHILFAGGIHDARSSAMVSVMAAPLAERGIRIGVLMGTAYLFTEEAVSCGAIVKTFQDQALACDQTINFETGPGHAIRCVRTPFSKEFYSVRRRAINSGISPAGLKETLESLTVGRLRVASKGVARDVKGELVRVEEEEQLRQGMYMIGQVATMRNSVWRIEALHKEVSESSTKILLESPQLFVEQVESQKARPSDIAIIGIGMLLPKAQEAETFWNNILRKVDTITEIPSHHWDWHLYFDPERKARDKIYSKWGGFIDDVPFDPLRFGIPPNSLKSISCSQLLTLEAVRRALEDAGYAAGNFDRERTSVILGNSEGGSMLCSSYATRAMIPLFVESPSSPVWDRLPEWTEESFPGTLTNVAAGRVANRFDLGGSNFTVDAACASSLAAIDLAVNELESGRSNVVITGGVDFSQSPYFYIAFSKTHALSPKGRARTFDKSADGIVISEGVAILVLKRLTDAERDGDRIYAIIKGAAGSSDGKAMGLTAPRPVGQMRTVERAYRKAGIRLSTLGLYEAHGTGTVVGDKAELETIVSSLNADDAPSKACAIGSIKTLIGHTKTAAGVVGLAKAALALYHKALPPHAGVEDPLDAIAKPNSPVYLLKEARPWLVHPDHSRRSGVSAFGFGGTNNHAVLEEYAGESRRRAPGGQSWPSELFVLRAENRSLLAEEIRSLLNALEAGAEPRLRDLAFSYANGGHATRRSRGVCLSLVVEGLARLQEELTLALAALQDNTTEQLPPHIMLRETAAVVDQSIAFVFPGQGAQYPNMAREMALYFEEIRAAIESADAYLRSQYPKLLSQYIYPPGAYSQADDRLHEEELTNTHVAQPAIGVVSIGFLDLSRRLGLVPSMVCGHSYGEYSALHAAGALSREEFLRLSEARGRIMMEACSADGAMAVVHAPREEVQTRLNGDKSVVIANHNAPRQTVISGLRQAVKEMTERLSAAGINSSLLPVSGPFHSPLMVPANLRLSGVIAACNWQRPSLPVYSNVTARPYEMDEDVLREQVARHLLSPVEFVGQIEQMYRDGARVFIELGPRNILTGLIDKILAGREHLTVSVEGKSGGLRGFLLALSALTVHGVDLNLPALFDGRDVKQLDLHRLVELTKKPALSPATWMLNGAGVRTQMEAVGYAGKLPSLNEETSKPAKEQPAFDAATNSHAAPVPLTDTHMVSNGRDGNTHGSPPLSGNEQTLAAYQAYQKTMQQFLSLQEEALKHFLNLQQSQMSLPANTATSTTPFVAPVSPPDFTAPGNLEQGNGNGVSAHVASIRVPDAVQEQRSVAPQANAPIPEAINQQQPSTEMPDRASLIQILVHLVSEHTGYPPEMLGLDLDLEAELGVDSIKRIEILDGFQKKLPLSLASKMQEHLDQFTKVKSLNELVETLMREIIQSQQVGPTLQESDAALTVIENQAATLTPRERIQRRPGDEHEKRDKKLEEGSTDDDDVCPRYILKPEEEPLPEHDSIVPDGLFIIAEDQLSVARYVSESLRERGARTAILDSAVLASPEELKRAVAELRRAHGPIKGIVHLSALAHAEDLPATLAEWRRHTQIESKSLFQLLRICADSVAGEQWTGSVLSASLLGGFFGREGICGPGLPTGGSSYGLLKTVAAEWPGVNAKSLDFDHRLSAEEIASRIVDELLLVGGQLEVGYPGGRRTIFRIVSSPLNVHNARARMIPEADWVVMLTGGAQGITAEVARAFAVPGMKMIIIGRSPEPVDESAATKGIEEVAVLRRIFMEQDKNNGGALTPAKIESKIQALFRQRAISRNLNDLRQAGVEVEYAAVDVRDEAAFGSLIAQVYSHYGRLDALVHGAGVIEDKLLKDKNQDSFDRVFDTKVDSAFILSRYLQPASLKLVVLFSSIAGRYGNRGQADYAAANEVMNRFAWRMQRSFPATRVVAINWGPWATTGMASEAVNRQFKERGLIPIGTQAGCRFFMEEISYAGRDEAEVIAGECPWALEDSDAVDDLSNLLLNINALTENFWTM